MLSESIEEHETGVPSPKFSLLRFLGDAAVGAVHASRRVVVYLFVILGLLILGVALPVVGTITATVLGFIATRASRRTTPTTRCGPAGTCAIATRWPTCASTAGERSASARSWPASWWCLS